MRNHKTKIRILSIFFVVLVLVINKHLTNLKTNNMKKLFLISLVFLMTSSIYSQQTMEELYGISFNTKENSTPVMHKSSRAPAILPFFCGFETGTLESCFSFTSSVGTGRCLILKDSTNTWGTTSAHSGLYYLVLDCKPTGLNRNDLDLHLDLAGEAQAILSFWWSDFNDESHAEDGVWISDNGVSFSKILNLPGGDYVDLQWNFFEIDIDSAATANGMSLTSNFIIRFSQYDDYWIHGGNDGHLYDDINVQNPLTTSVNNQYTSTEIKIYPNPVNDFCSVIYNINKESLVHVNVYDLTGQSHYSKTLVKEQKGPHKEDIDFSAFSSGLYFISIKINDNLKVYKIIKE